jgi:hypothetical protein
MNYATLYEVKQSLELLANSDHDALLTKYLNWSSRLIENYKDRRYDVRYETIAHDAPLRARGEFGVFDRAFMRGDTTRPLILLDDLLQMDTLTNGDGEEIVSTDYILEPVRRTPKSVINLLNNEYWVADDDGNVRGAISVAGWWGYHSSYQSAWVDSLATVLDNPLTLASTAITVGAISGAAADLESPRFQTGQLLRIEDELIYLVQTTEVESANDTLTVVRGYNGSTAAQHAAGAKIEIFRPEGFVVQACERLVHWRYKQRDTDGFDKTYVAGTGVVSVPAALPADVRDILGAKGRPSL